MKKPTLLLVLVACLARPLVAAEFEVLAVTGAVEPESLQAGQQLGPGTRVTLEPWGRAVIRESGKCSLTHVVVGLSEHPLALSEDCSKTDEPMSVVGRIQQGEAFAARLDESAGAAGQVVMALSHDACAYLPTVSEEGTGKRQCPSGYGLRGLRCTGAHCDNKDLMCCPYLDGAPDPNTKQVQARQISEEFPNTVKSKNFLNGLTCYGPYCDNVLPHAFKSSRLVNTRTCDWSPWDSDRPSTWLVCGADQFVAGLRCRGDYCGDVGLYCCQSRPE